MRSQSWYSRFAKVSARLSGRPVTFAVAVVVLLTWALTGPLFGFSDTWQLIINTGTFMDPGRAQWVEWQKGLLSRGNIIEGPQACALGEALDLWRIG